MTIRPRFQFGLHAASACALLCAACVGIIGDGDEPAGSPSSSTQEGADLASVAAQATKECQATPSYVPPHRLNAREYDNVIRDLTGLDSKPATNFPPDPYIAHFSNIADSLGVDGPLAQAYFDTAALVLDDALARAPKNIVSCDPARFSGGARACAEKVIREFGKKAFRRPLSTAEESVFFGLFDATGAIVPSQATDTFVESLKAPLQAILISPQFLYRTVEVPAHAEVHALSDHEIASRVSFFLWGSIPDAALLDLAAAGKLKDPGTLTREIDRMMADPKASHLVSSFAMQWLNLEALATVAPVASAYPSFDDAVRKDMLTESAMLLKDVVGPGGTPYALLTADYTYLNRRLATHYGLPDPGSDQFVKTSLAGTPRVGLLTHGSVLTVNARPDESSIVKRGLWVLERVLCTEIPPPPNNVSTNLEAAGQSLNPRKQLEAHASAPQCAGCHSMIDPPGLALESFDGVGRWRSHYKNGDVVDSSGKMADGVSFDGPRSIGTALAESPRVSMCLSRHALTFAVGRALGDTDKCVADAIGQKVLSPKAGTMADLVKVLVLSDGFLKQKRGQ